MAAPSHGVLGCHLSCGGNIVTLGEENTAPRLAAACPWTLPIVFLAVKRSVQRDVGGLLLSIGVLVLNPASSADWFYDPSQNRLRQIKGDGLVVVLVCSLTISLPGSVQARVNRRT